MSSPTSFRRQLSLLALLTASLYACNGKGNPVPGTDHPPGPDNGTDPSGENVRYEERDQGDRWDTRWAGSFTAYMGGMDSAKAIEACASVEDKTKGAFVGKPLFLLQLGKEGYETFDGNIPNPGEREEDTPEQNDERKDELPPPRNAKERLERKVELLKSSDLGKYCWVEARTDSARALATEAWNPLLDWAMEYSIEMIPDNPSTVPLTLGDNAQETKELVGVASPVEPSSSGENLVRVVIADTEPSGPFDPFAAGQTEHGRATAKIVHTLLCEEIKPTASSTTSTSCGVGIYFEQALPYAVDSTAPMLSRIPEVVAPSGLYGTHMSLATAIDRVTDRYVEDRIPTVLNLSLGWNPGLESKISLADYRGISKVDGAVSEKDVEANRLRRVLEFQRPTGIRGDYERSFDALTAGEKAVMEALIRARCEGIVPIVAAGNRTNYPTERPDLQNGPLLPAGWMDQLNTGSKAECTNHRYLQGAWAEGEPLVFAISGVDQKSRPVGLGRPGGNAPFAALALGVTVQDSRANLDESGYHTISGTSASAGVASAAIAGAWAREPTMDGDKVLRKIYDAAKSALPISGTGVVRADFGTATFGGDAKVTKVLHVCAAANAVQQTDTCPPAGTPSTTTASTDSDAETGTPVAPATQACSTTTDAPCAAKYHPTPDALRYVWPQPPAQGCPPCALEVKSAPDAPQFQSRIVIATREADPFWQSDDFKANNDLKAFHLELVDKDGTVTVHSYSSEDDLELFMSGDNRKVQAIVDAEIDIHSANLVLEGNAIPTGVGRSWNVPLPMDIISP